MNDIVFRPFKKQVSVLEDPARFLGVFCGKRAGKTEIGAVKFITRQEQKPNYRESSIDPYLGVVLAPTYEMLSDLSWKKFLLYAKPFIKRDWKSPKTVLWHDNSEIRGLSADKPERLEGRKVNHAWIDEVFQVEEQTYSEMEARISDTLGYILCTGSLGVQYVNPKMHWAYKYFKLTRDKNVSVHEWATCDNPYFPREEIERLRAKLDARTFAAMFEINWDIISENAVYADWTSENEVECKYDPNLPLYISIDWGWAHPMVCLFIQFDRVKKRVYVIDEIYESQLKIKHMASLIAQKGMSIYDGCSDIAGNQEREQSGISNIEEFEEAVKLHGIKLRLKISRAKVLPSIAIVRSWVKTAAGERRLFVNPQTCPRTISSIKNYRYASRHGVVLNENPVKENDDGCDALRYFFINFIDEPQTIKVSQYA